MVRRRLALNDGTMGFRLCPQNQYGMENHVVDLTIRVADGILVAVDIDGNHVKGKETSGPR